MTDVFISYSRRDKVFVSRLFDALNPRKRDIWVDWKGIPYSAEWWKEICAGIEAADNFIFVISPESLGSRICNDELAYATKHNKRIIPVVRREIDDQHMAGVWANQEWASQARQNWDALKKINWLYFRRKDECECQFDDGEVVDPACDSPDCDQDDFTEAYQALIKTVQTDDDHVRRHTRLLVRAREWESNAHNPSFLLRGDDLVAAQSWLRDCMNQQPQPTALQSQYIQASAKAEAELRAHEEATQRRVRAFRRATLILAVVGAIAVIATGIASI